MLAACNRGGPAPTPPTATIDDTFVIVTPTPSDSGRRAPAPEGRRVYVVEPGDTQSSIAAQCGVTEEALMEANNLIDPGDIEVGQVLMIPPTDDAELECSCPRYVRGLGMLS
ncbi:MAG TPA: LysM domain-containing protein [Thermomicrobiales bacterium]|nr:LysM domain-containing protein [Thermomicrobiales bacterium]